MVPASDLRMKKRFAMRIRAVLLALTFTLPAAAQDWVAGVEATSGASYTYLTHYSRSGPVIFWQTFSYLTYRVRESGVETRVNSPGVATGVMYRWQEDDLSAGIGGGYEVRWTERQSGGAPRSETEQGPIIEGDVAWRFATRTAARVAGRWSGANDWTAASAEIRQELTRRIRVGPQVIWQGNDDITVVSAGGFVEFPLGETALQLRAGQARIDHRDGTTQTQPYFSAGIVVPF